MRTSGKIIMDSAIKFAIGLFCVNAASSRADITNAFSDSFTRAANGGPYADWSSVSGNAADPGGVSWSKVRAFLYPDNDGSSDGLLPTYPIRVRDRDMGTVASTPSPGRTV